MGSQYSSVEDLKNDATLRKMIENAIKGSIEQAREYQEQVTKVTIVDSKAHQIGSNYIYTDDYPLLGSPETPITFKQTTNATSVVKTNYLFSYFNKYPDKITQAIAYDSAGLSEKSSTDTDLSNWYDPKSIIEMLGYTVDEARFNFDKYGIEYKLLVAGMTSEEYKKQVQEEYDTTESARAIKRQWNQTYQVSYEFYKDKQDQLDALNEKLTQLWKSDDLTEEETKLTEIQNQISNLNTDVNAWLTDFTATDIFKAYRFKYLVKNNNENDYDFTKDSTVNDAYNAVVNNTLFKSTYQSVLNKFKTNLKQQMIENGTWDSSKTDDENLSPITSVKYLSFTLYFEDDYVSDFALSNANELKDLQKLIRAFINAFYSFTTKITYGALGDIANYVNSSEETREKFLPDFGSCGDQSVWSNAYDIYSTVKQEMSDAASLQIKISIEQAKFEKDHQDLQNQITEVQSQIETLTALLSSDEATTALTHYPYYETDPIDEDLLAKLREDKIKAELAFEKLEENDQQKDTMKLYDAQNKASNAESNVEFWKMCCQNTQTYAYFSSYQSQTSGVSFDTLRLYAKLYTDERIIKAREELIKETDEKLQQYITMAQVVEKANDEELNYLYTQFYTQYKEECEKHMGIDAIVNFDYEHHSDKKKIKKWLEEEGDYNIMKTNYETYKDALTNKETYQAEYDKMKKEYDAKYENYAEDYSNLLKNLSTYSTNYSTARSTWKHYNEVCGDGYTFMAFDDLYDLLVSGYTHNISDKIINIESKIENTVTNITESVYLLAMNIIHVEGRFAQKVSIVQDHTVLQSMADNLKEVETQVKSITFDTPIETKSSVNWSKIIRIIIIVIISLLAVFVIGLIIKKYIDKRRIRKQTIMWKDIELEDTD